MEQSMLSKKRGYLLIEAMVAMGVLTTSVLGIFALMSQSIKLTRVIDDQYVGTYLAAEGIEITKNLLDTNFLTNPELWNANGFSDSPACYEIDINTEVLPAAGCSNTYLGFNGSLYVYGGGTVTGFSRSVKIVPLIDPVGGSAQEGVQVVSTVKWGGGGSSIALEDKFYNWH